MEMIVPKLFYVAVVLFCLSENALGQTRCCYPKQYTADILAYGAQLIENQPSLLDGMTRVFMDYTNKRLAYHYSHSPVAQQIIDYSAHKAYLVVNGNCSISNLPTGSEMPEECVAANATFMGSGYMGKEEKGAKFEAWTTVFGTNGEIRLDTVNLVHSCIPLVSYTTGPMPGPISAFTATFGLYTNYRPGIDDMSVFNVPTGCHSLTRNSPLYYTDCGLNVESPLSLSNVSKGAMTSLEAS